MKIIHLNLLTLVFIVFSYVLDAPSVAAQDKTGQGGSQPNYKMVLALLKKSAGNDRQAANSAKQELEKLGDQINPLLLEIFEKEKGCSERIEALGHLPDTELSKALETAVPALVKIASDFSLFDGKKTWLCRRYATIYLGLSSAAGIRALTTLLTNRDSWVRQNAAFGFEELTEGEVTGERLTALKEAIPALEKATKDKDEIVREVSAEALEQANGLISHAGNRP